MRRYPAEWETQSGIQLTWPHEHSDWAPWLSQVEPVFVEIARQVCRFEKLLLVCRDEAHRQHVGELLQQVDIDPHRIEYHCLESNDTWARDHGPISVVEDGAPLLLDFIFNGWGNKFEAGLDNAITPGLQQQGAFHGTKVEVHEFVLEGGGLESDGQGTLLTTSHCLLSPQRNPDFDRAGIEAYLQRALGVKRILWLEHGQLEGDDTDSHIDTLARFADPHTLVYVACDEPGDSHFQSLKAMEAELQALRQTDGRPYELLPLPWPRPAYNDEGERLPASYANFLILNGAVLAPTYRDPADGRALEVLRQAFPNHEVIGIDCLPLIYQYGSLHCVTMNYYDDIL